MVSGKFRTTILFYLIFSVTLYGQSHIIIDSAKRYPPAIFIDSQLVNLSLIYLDMGSVDHINIIDGLDTTSKTNGKIFVSLKYPHPVFLTLADISDVIPKLNGYDIMYIIDDSLIDDTTGIKIDPSYVIQTHAFISTRRQEKSNTLCALGIVIIQTKRRSQIIEKWDKVIHMW
jgi:hypothetical protein